MGAIASLFGYVLEFWYNICQNYGVSIILFALTIKAIMYPLTLKQQKSMKKTQEMQPKLLELQERYKDNQEAMMVEYQKLMSENKYNPFGGCLLTFIQLPILLGVFYVVASPLTYMEKMEQTEIDKYVQQIIVDSNYSGDEQAFIADNKDTSKTIEDYKSTNRYYELKLIKENNLYNLDFFGINLGDIAAENKSDFTLLIIPVLTTVFLYLSLYVVQADTKKQQKQVMKDADGNEIPMPNMMAMNFVMPLMSGYISYVVPQGMGLFWFTNSLIQIIMQIGMKKYLKAKEDTKLIEGKKK
ncbi:MAG: membrane protein insertase YidC [Clostridia bacterium]|nr:membrane protein insertase YidC [Clostridia bacterium]